MDIDGTLFDKDVVAPDLVEQLRAAVYALDVRHEKVQQAKFGRAELERLAVAEDAMRGGAIRP